MPPSRYPRREVLHTGSIGLLGAIAGCSTSGESGTPPADDSPNPTDTATIQTESPAQTTAGSADAQPGPRENATLTTGPTVSVDSRFDGEPCPTFGSPARTVCYHTVGRDPEVYMRPEDGREAVGRSTANCVPSHTFTLINRTDAEMWTNTGTFRVMRESEEGWQQVLPADDTGWCAECLERLPPAGGFHQWSLAIDKTHPSPYSTNVSYTGPLTSEPGLHAFVADANEENPESASAPAIRCVVLFDLVGGPVECS